MRRFDFPPSADDDFDLWQTNPTAQIGPLAAVFLAHETQSHYVDVRRLLVDGKPNDREHSGV